MKAKIFLLTIIFVVDCVVYSHSATLEGRPAKSPHSTSAKRHRVMSTAALTKNLQFGFSLAEVNEEYTEQLDQLAGLLSKGNLAVALRGHADTVGTYVGNWKLSEKRALAVKEYLVSKGVPADKIVTTPFGSTVPIASNKSREGRKKNRRVEIRLQQLPGLATAKNKDIDPM